MSGQLHAPTALLSEEPPIPFEMRQNGLQNRFGRCREEKNLLPLPGIKPRPSSPYPAATPTELLRLNAVCDVVMNDEWCIKKWKEAVVD
jgi:hypothetical protein